MTNPLGTLTEKFDTLSSDVQSYIAAVQADINSLASSVDAGNAILSDILSALSQLQSTMQTAADCACEAASTLQEIADNQPPPPPLPMCEDPQADILSLSWGQVGNAVNWVNISGQPNNMRGDLGPLRFPLNTETGPGGGLILPGPSWYRIRGFYPIAPYNYWTFQYSLDGNATQIANPVAGDENVFEVFFASGGENMVWTLIGNENAGSEGDDGLYNAWYLDKCEEPQ